MSATVRFGGCPARPAAMSFRNERAARAGRDRARQRQARDGVPQALRIARYQRCRACRRWHVGPDPAAVRAFLDATTSSGRAALDAALAAA